MPGLTPLSLNNENVGDEGDLALDQADNTTTTGLNSDLYFAKQL